MDSLYTCLPLLCSLILPPHCLSLFLPPSLSISPTPSIPPSRSLFLCLSVSHTHLSIMPATFIVLIYLPSLSFFLFAFTASLPLFPFSFFICLVHPPFLSFSFILRLLPLINSPAFSRLGISCPRHCKQRRRAQKLNLPKPHLKRRLGEGRRGGVRGGDGEGTAQRGGT